MNYLPNEEIKIPISRVSEMISQVLSDYKSKVIEAMPDPMEETYKRTEQEPEKDELAFIAGYNASIKQALNNIDKI